MVEDKREDPSENINQEENKENQFEVSETEQTDDVESIRKALSELNNKYLRLYADFENYKRIVVKDKEELIKYSNENLMKELLSVIDHLELALEHSSKNEPSTALAEGVEMTLKELNTILEKFGLSSIEALDKLFNPSVHHAITQIESEDSKENTVMSEFRKGYMLKDRVLRAALVAVSKKAKTEETEKIEETQEE